MTPVIHVLWNRLLGDRGERAAARYLRRQGMRVLTRGFRATSGEIDLIARDGDTLVFVEVKARRQGVPAEAVTPEKQRRITLASLSFLRKHRLLEQRCRFDIVAIIWPDDRREPQIEHIRDAFEAVGRGQMFRLEYTRFGYQYQLRLPRFLEVFPRRYGNRSVQFIVGGEPVPSLNYSLA